MLVGGFCVLVRQLAVFVSRFGMLLRLFMFFDLVMMRGLMVMMRRSVVMSGSLKMVLG